MRRLFGPKDSTKEAQNLNDLQTPQQRYAEAKAAMEAQRLPNLPNEEMEKEVKQRIMTKPEVEYVAVPTCVSVEEMFNILFQKISKIEQMLNQQ